MIQGTMQLNQVRLKLRDNALYMHETLQLAFRNNAMASMSFSPFRCSGTSVVSWWEFRIPSTGCRDKNVEKVL